MAQQGEFPGSIFIPGPCFGFPQGAHGRRGFPIRYIVVHGTGWPYTLDQYIAEGTRKGGVHYMIGKDGRIVQFVREADASWGNGKIEAGADAFWRAWRTSDKGAMTLPGIVNPNLTTISIEHEKFSKTNADLPTPAQVASSFRLIAYLCAKYNIPRKLATGTDGGIVGHHSMEPVTRSFCPGPYPWQMLLASLNPTPAPKPSPIQGTLAPFADSDSLVSYLMRRATSGTMPAALVTAFRAALDSAAQ